MDEVEGSHPGSSSFFVGTTRQLRQLDSSRRKRLFSKKMKNDVDREDAKNAGAGAATKDGRTGRRTWNGYEKWFGSFRRRLNG